MAQREEKMEMEKKVGRKEQSAAVAAKHNFFFFWLLLCNDEGMGKK